MVLKKKNDGLRKISRAENHGTETISRGPGMNKGGRL